MPVIIKEDDPENWVSVPIGHRPIDPITQPHRPRWSFFLFPQLSYHIHTIRKMSSHGGGPKKWRNWVREYRNKKREMSLFCYYIREKKGLCIGAIIQPRSYIVFFFFFLCYLCWWCICFLCVCVCVCVCGAVWSPESHAGATRSRSGVLCNYRLGK
jgi:hypothetical protein